MTTSRIEIVGGVPTLTVNGKAVAQTAYITYIAEKNRYEDFAKKGYKLYSIPVFFSNMTINDSSQLPPFSKGIFDGIYKGEEPDFSALDDGIAQILKVCPDAYIFPRINLSLPGDWEDNNPDELLDFGFTPHKRVCFSSDKWANETKRLLKMFLEHAESMPYADNICGYQLAGGNTEEWFSFDLKGSHGKRSREGFEKYRLEKGLCDNEYEYYRYLSETVAGRICDFAAFAKSIIKRELAIGTFYGYTLECHFRSSCHHALRTILECPDVDFICSPISYDEQRPKGRDHANMLPVDSLKLAGKLYFTENDTRTHISTPPNDIPYYNSPVWRGPDRLTTCELIKMHFSRALTHGHASWWFDMWGGWYNDEKYMSLFEKTRNIAEESLAKSRKSDADLAVFIDEKTYAAISEENEDISRKVCYTFRKTLGSTAVPYDIFLADDFDKIKDNYKAYMFLVPKASKLSDKNEKTALDEGKKYIEINESNAGMSAGELREKLMDLGLKSFANAPCVVYSNVSYIFFHTAEDGEYTFEGCDNFTDVFTGEKLEFPKFIEKGKSFLFEK